MPRAALTPARLIETGAKLADEIGFEQVTLSVLARHFGVKVASLYSHLDGAQALSTGIALYALGQLADLAGAAIAGRAGKEALTAIADAHRDFARSRPGLFDATRYRLDADAAAASAGPRLAELLRLTLRGYALPPLEETHAVRLLGSTLLGFLLLERSGGFAHSTPPADASWRRNIDALDQLLRNWPATTD